MSRFVPDISFEASGSLAGHSRRCGHWRCCWRSGWQEPLISVAVQCEKPVLFGAGFFVGVRSLALDAIGMRCGRCCTYRYQRIKPAQYAGPGRANNRCGPWRDCPRSRPGFEDGRELAGTDSPRLSVNAPLKQRALDPRSSPPARRAQNSPGPGQHTAPHSTVDRAALGSRGLYPIFLLRHFLSLPWRSSPAFTSSKAT